LDDEAAVRHRAQTALRDAEAELEYMAQRAKEDREILEARMQDELISVENANARALALAHKKHEESKQQAELELRSTKAMAQRQLDEEHARAEEQSRQLRALHAREIDMAKQALEEARAQAALEMKELRSAHAVQVADITAKAEQAQRILREEARREQEAIRAEHAIVLRRQREAAARELATAQMKYELEAKLRREKEELLNTLRIDMISRAREHALASEARATRQREAANDASVHAAALDHLAGLARDTSAKSESMSLTEGQNARAAVDALRVLEQEFGELIGSHQMGAISDGRVEDGDDIGETANMTEEQRIVWRHRRRSVRLAKQAGQANPKGQWDEMLDIEREIEQQ